MRSVTVTSQEEPYGVQISNGRHWWSADEPIEAGGTDSGPSPYELLLSAVGACMVITAQMYATRKGWPLQSMEVKLAHSRVKAQDCADCETKAGHVSIITIDVSMAGELDASQRQRILEIAGRCPVKRTLEGEVKVRSKRN